MFFSLFLNVFTNILKIYKLPKIYNKILKKLLKIIIYQVTSNFIENVHLGTKDLFGTKLKKILGRILLKNVVPKEPFFFAASDIVPIIYNKPCICTADQYLWKGWDYSNSNNLFQKY